MASFLKDPNSVEPFYIIWCSPDNTNDGGASDTGMLQGATISTTTWTVATGLTKDSENETSVTIKGVTYAVNTLACVWLSSGSHGTNYDVACKITTSDSRTLEHTITIKVKNQ